MGNSQQLKMQLIIILNFILIGSILICNTNAQINGVEDDDESTLSKRDSYIFQRLSNDIDLKSRDFKKLSSQFESLSKSIQEKNSNQLMSEMKSEIIQALRLEIQTFNTELKSQINQTLELDIKFQAEQRRVNNLQDLIGQLKSNITTLDSELKQCKRDKSTEISSINQKINSLNTAITNSKSTQIPQGSEQNVLDILFMVQNLRRIVEHIAVNSLSMRGYLTKSIVDLYYSSFHKGRTEKIDFRGCDSKQKSCCKNLVALKSISESINTHDSCVILYHELNCSGKYGMYYPGNETRSHSDFGEDRNKYKSISTCF